jgi:nucleoside-diphosphate-sugar epimerase
MDHLIIGCGYLGHRIAALWRAHGHRVFVTTRRADQAAAWQALGYHPLVCDVLDPASLRSLARASTVVHAVGLDRASGQSMRDVYVQGLANVLAALPAPQRFLYVSSSSVYGQTDGSWVDESSPTEPLEESGKIVLEAEELLRARLPMAIVLRFAGIYGPGRLLRQKSIQAGEPIVGDPDKWLNLIHVEDGAAAVLAAQTRGVPGAIYNICDGEPVRRRDFYTDLARLLKAPPPRFASPPPGQRTPPHEKANRRIGNRRMREEIGVRLHCADYRSGLVGSVGR